MSMPAPIGAIVYRRRQHVINLFVAQTASTERHAAKIETIQGFNIRRWSDSGLNYWAVSDIAADELAEFGEKFEAAMRTIRVSARVERLAPYRSCRISTRVRWNRRFRSEDDAK